MRILKKEGPNILVVASHTEEVRLGDYLMVTEKERSLVLQVIDENYLNVDGIEEEVAREEILLSSVQGMTEDPADVNSISKEIRDMRLLLCKARGSIEHGRHSPRIDHLENNEAKRERHPRLRGQPWPQEDQDREVWPGFLLLSDG